MGVCSGTVSRRDGVAFTRTGCWMLDIRIAIGTPRYDVPLFDACLSLFLFSTALRPPLLLGSGPSSRLPPAQSEALGGGGKVDGWRGRMGAVGEEGEPRERNSAACRKEAPEGALRMLQSLGGVPSVVRLFLPLGIQFHVKLLSFRLENRVEFHSESFFRKYTLSTMYP
jgi:hypothetical protein